MTRLHKVLSIALVLCAFFCSSHIFGQDKGIDLTISIQDEYKQSISDVTILVSSATKELVGITNTKGIVDFKLSADNYRIEVTHIGYESSTTQINLLQKKAITIQLTSLSNILQEMVITAKEGKGLTSTSVINRQAMEHLQPSSFSDLMELLPGGQAKDPVLTGKNPVLLRETGKQGYDTGSLGVQFILDGNPINSNADLQVSSYQEQMLSSGKVDAKRNTIGTGVDMRTLSTNDIESVEITRGIPTAAYGDLTSGLIQIKRKIGYTPLQARFKADGFSKMYYVGKGVDTRSGWKLNLSMDYLDAKNEPTNTLENYKRISTSFRTEKSFVVNGYDLIWNANLDYNSTIDNDKFDPDSGYARTDRYKNTRQNISIANNFKWEFDKENVFKKITLNTAFSQGIEDIKGTTFVQQTGFKAISTSRETGINQGYYLPLSYVSDFRTEGRPVNINVKLQTELGINTSGIAHNIETGIDFRYSKNNGKGEVYDPLLPPSKGLVNSRTRPFSDIPASQILAGFIGDRMEYETGNHHFQLYTGVRLSKMLGIESDFSTSDRVYAEPRVNFQWGLPDVRLGQDVLKTDVTLGYGELYKQPTLSLLYPNDRYFDMLEVNYFDQVNNNSYAQFNTFKLNTENHSLVAAKNIKREIRLDLSYKKHKLFVTYFNERMNNGFRDVNYFRGFEYKKYETTGLQWNDDLGHPNLEGTLYEDRLLHYQYSMRENGSNTFKDGIEFGYSSPRIEGINTRFTLNGAWFKTIYSNSSDFYYRPGITLNGKDYPYVGIYADDNGYKKSSMVYNLVIDTYVPSIDMNISASLQGDLFRREQMLNRVAEPYAYFGFDNEVHSFTEEDKTDPMLQNLVRNVSTTDGMQTRLPFTFNANFKVSKRIYKSVKASMFVNRLFTHYQSYTLNGVKVNRKDTEGPYFGMEINFNI
ncbi:MULTISPECIES: TonB-dependent receptor plug domain-containing protein [unclassified Myroides]|uniref:TonB-dependent receptor plug domain-containing protein n=1 Tax=unclassified Myroides TaxID=2642485 RepID=UPI0031012A92